MCILTNDENKGTEEIGLVAPPLENAFERAAAKS